MIRVLRTRAAAVPCKIHRLLSENGTHFSGPGGGGWTPENIKTVRAETAAFRCHAFEAACADLDIAHRHPMPRNPKPRHPKPRHPKPRHPTTNGLVERMKRALKDATVKRFHRDKHEQPRLHLQDFVDAHIFARRLTTLEGLAPYEFISDRGQSKPDD